MRHRQVILFTLRLLIATFLLPQIVQAQHLKKKTRILFLLDGSSSMTYQWNVGYSRFDVASHILLKIMDSVYTVNNEIQFAVRAYGTGYPAQLQNCFDTRLEVPFNLQNTNQIKTRLRNLIPIGSSPIAFSLKQASENELNEVVSFDYSVIFITDGGESCNGDVCAIYKDLLQKKISIKPYIIGLDKNETLKSYYACMGSYIEVSTVEDIQRAINLILDANKSIIDKPKELKLQTIFSNVQPIKADSQTIVKTIPKDTVTPEIKPEEPRIAGFINSLKVMKLPLLLKKEKLMISPADPGIEKAKSVSLHFDFTEPKQNAGSLDALNVMNRSLKNAKPLLGGKKINLKTSKKVSIVFDYEEEKKLAPSFADLSVYPLPNPLKTSKASIKAKKPTILLAKKVSVAFDYEEDKKLGPSFADLSVFAVPNPLKNSKALIKVKKPTISLAKKVSVKFDYEEEKKVSLTLGDLSPSFASIALQAGKPSLKIKKPNIAQYKKASLKFEYEEPKKISPEFNVIDPVYKLITLPAATASIKGKKPNLGIAKKASVRFEYEEEKKWPLATIRMIPYPRRYSYAFRIPRPERMILAKSRASLRFTIEEEKKAVAKKDTVLAIQPPLGTTIKFETEDVASQETLVQVYFKGTNGKTYPTAKPTIVMQDARTNRDVVSFKRDMKGNEPVPQKVPAGVYNLVIKGFDDLFANNIEIKPNTLKKVFVEVKDGVLKFTYQGNIKRPVTEYFAIVNRRFAAGANVKQQCTDVLTYEPGTYYIEVNTLPPYKGSIDLTFDATYEIQLNEPGTLKIMNDKPMGKLQLQTTLGDQYVTFYTMDITGDPSKQTVNLMPFTFKLLYPANPQMPQAGNKELMIRIRSNNQMELYLK